MHLLVSLCTIPYANFSLFHIYIFTLLDSHIREVPLKTPGLFNFKMCILKLIFNRRILYNFLQKRNIFLLLKRMWRGLRIIFIHFSFNNYTSIIRYWRINLACEVKIFQKRMCCVLCSIEITSGKFWKEMNNQNIYWTPRAPRKSIVW